MGSWLWNDGLLSGNVSINQKAWPERFNKIATAEAGCVRLSKVAILTQIGDVIDLHVVNAKAAMLNRKKPFGCESYIEG